MNHPLDSTRGRDERPVYNKQGDLVSWVGPRSTSIGAAKAAGVRGCYQCFLKMPEGGRIPAWREVV